MRDRVSRDDTTIEPDSDAMPAYIPSEALEERIGARHGQCVNLHFMTEGGAINL